MNFTKVLIRPPGGWWWEQEPTRGSPTELGFVRSPSHDGLSKEQPTWEVWRSPEGVLVTLPPGCGAIGVLTVVGTRGETTAVVEPDGVFSVWPKKGKSND